MKDVFGNYNPELGDSLRFMEKLDRRLDAIECVKQVHDREIMRCKYMVVLAFALGLLAGGAVVAVVLSNPGLLRSFSFGAGSGVLMFVEQNLFVMLTGVVVLAMCFAAINVFNALVDIRTLRSARRQVRGSDAQPSPVVRGERTR